MQGTSPRYCAARATQLQSFEEMLQRWRAVGNTVSDMTDPKFESQTSRFRNQCVTAGPAFMMNQNFSLIIFPKPLKIAKVLTIFQNVMQKLSRIIARLSYFLLFPKLRGGADSATLSLD